MTAPAAERSPQPVRDIRVVVTKAAWVTPLIRRLVFSAEGLAQALATPEGAYAPYFKLLLGPPTQPVVRTYSVRRLDPTLDELHVDFVLHDHEGPGSLFGRHARPGDEARLRGPGCLAPVACSDHRLAADHCALPALCHLLEHLPSNATGEAVIEVPGETEMQDLKAPAGIAIQWLLRREGSPSLIAHRFGALRSPAASDVVVWAGAEAHVARDLRRIARTRWGVTPPHCQVLNYWRRGRPEGTFSFVE